jgi:hypothetical protein
VTEEYDYGPKNKFLLHFTQSYDPETDVQIFTNYNEDGTVRLTFTAKEERVVSYWQKPSDQHEFGSTVCFKVGDDHPCYRRCPLLFPRLLAFRAIQSE